MNSKLAAVLGAISGYGASFVIASLQASAGSERDVYLKPAYEACLNAHTPEQYKIAIERTENALLYTRDLVVKWDIRNMLRLCKDKYETASQAAAEAAQATADQQRKSAETAANAKVAYERFWQLQELKDPKHTRQ